MSLPPLTHAEIGRLFPICCAADISTEAKDRFLQQSQDYGSVMLQKLVFVNTLPPDPPTPRTPSTATVNPAPPASQFKSRSAAECTLLLQQLRRNGSDIDLALFVIVDERSLQDEHCAARKRLSGRGRQGVWG